MTRSVAELLEDTLNLGDSERAERAGLIAASLDAPPPPTIHPAWAGEIRRRVDDYESGAVRAIPGADPRREILSEIDAGTPIDG